MKKLTITVDDDVYEYLHKVIGRGNISRCLNNAARGVIRDRLPVFPRNGGEHWVDRMAGTATVKDGMTTTDEVMKFLRGDD